MAGAAINGASKLIGPPMLAKSGANEEIEPYWDPTRGDPTRRALERDFFNLAEFPELVLVDPFAIFAAQQLVRIGCACVAAMAPKELAVQAAGR